MNFDRLFLTCLSKPQKTKKSSATSGQDPLFICNQNGSVSDKNTNGYEWSKVKMLHSVSDLISHSAFEDSPALIVG